MEKKECKNKLKEMNLIVFQIRGKSTHRIQSLGYPSDLGFTLI